MTLLSTLLFPLPRLARLRTAWLPAALLTMAAAQAQDKPACRYLQVAKLPLHYRGPSLDITMDGTIDGTPAVMLADTGSSDTWLTRTATEKRGLRLRPSAHRIRGVGGMSATYTTRIDDFSAGPAKSSRGWVQVVGDTGTAPAFDAIVGAPYLLQTDMELSLADKEIRFFRPLGCEKSWLAYWASDAVVIPFEENSSGRRAENPRFTIEVNGQKMLAIIDSGASRTAIDAHAAERAGIRLDGPGVTSDGHSAGIGERRIANWRAHIATVKIGGEIVRDADVALMDTQGQLDVDVLLGADFLRAHRVLFAMGQRRIYLTYLGGDVFGNPAGIPPWLRQEAEAGNPDAQLALSQRYRSGQGVARDPALAAAWLDKAAAQGHPQADILRARGLMTEGRYAEAAARLKPALDRLPAERYGALWLYLARLRTGEQENGRRELDATFARNSDDAWPKPIAEHYLGRLDAAALLAAARRDGERAAVQTCLAERYLAALQAARQGTVAPAAQGDCEPAKP